MKSFIKELWALSLSHSLPLHFIWNHLLKSNEESLYVTSTTTTTNLRHLNIDDIIVLRNNKSWMNQLIAIKTLPLNAILLTNLHFRLIRIGFRLKSLAVEHKLDTSSIQPRLCSVGIEEFLKRSSSLDFKRFGDERYRSKGRIFQFHSVLNLFPYIIPPYLPYTLRCRLGQQPWDWCVPASLRCCQPYQGRGEREGGDVLNQSIFY